MNTEHLVEGIVQLIQKAETDLPKDVENALRHAQSRETGVAKTQLDLIIKNIALARDSKRPLCQDTGVQTFVVDVGVDFPAWAELKQLLKDGVRNATKAIPLRANAMNVLTDKNTGDNTGKGVPHVYWHLMEGSQVRITAFPKGGGSENMTRLGMLKPNVGWGGIKAFVASAVIEAGGKPCPPLVVGVGVGGDADSCLQLGKHALLRPLNTTNPVPFLQKVEDDIKSICNANGVGPMGLGGNTTVLAAHVSVADRHPAMLPVGVTMSCWALRRAQLLIEEDGSWEVL